jgi:hypothetical protein
MSLFSSLLYFRKKEETWLWDHFTCCVCVSAHFTCCVCVSAHFTCCVCVSARFTCCVCVSARLKSFNCSHSSNMYATSYERTVGFHVKAVLRLQTNAATATEVRCDHFASQPFLFVTHCRFWNFTFSDAFCVGNATKYTQKETRLLNDTTVR